MNQIKAQLKTFDEQDRYDFDADGNFDEPDGYIDHFQIVHAGGDQAAGDPIYGEDAIWSHRWYADINGFGVGPEGGAQFGGVDAGQGGVSDPNGSNVQVPDHPTGVWVGDYTIQPENGGLGVFAHEFGHDLGLPDLYDTSGNTGGAENSTGFWTLMSSGANIGRGGPNGIGDHPVDMGAWEKFQLGWLDYAVARQDRQYDFKLNPLSVQGRLPEAMFVLLPKKTVQLELGEPCGECGERYYYSGAGDEVTNTMTREVAGGGELTAQVNYDIEEGYDYAFLERQVDGGAWEPVETSESDLDNDCGESCTPGISGTTEGQWVELTADVPANTDRIRWRYTTDTAVQQPGFKIDNITLNGVDIGTAESGPEGWVFDSFRITTGEEEIKYFQAYIAENRQYRNYDRSLATAYNFGFENPDRVEFYPYQDGLLVNYWDTSQTDNNVGDHPGSGLVLPVDAHPFFDHTPDGALARPRIQSYDSTFGLEDTDPLRLHYVGEPYRIPSRDNVRLFSDRRNYWYDFDEHGSQHAGRYQPGWYSVDVPNTGTRIRVMDVDRNGVMSVHVGRRHP
jgi:immune inhibitor A